MQLTEYFYPDDVIVSVVDGVRIATLGYHWTTSPNGVREYHSDMPVIFEEGELNDPALGYHKAWLKARERYRDQQREIFFSSYPMVVEEREAQAAWDAAGKRWSVGAFAEWYHVRRKIRKEGEPWL